MRIFTIGYEGATQPDFIAALRAAGVERVIDVRAVPLSRRPGFSKNVLANGLRVTATLRHGVWGLWWPSDRGDPTGSTLLLRTAAGVTPADPKAVRLEIG